MLSKIHADVFKGLHLVGLQLEQSGLLTFEELSEVAVR